jgi:four helix bundle protein
MYQYSFEKLEVWQGSKEFVKEIYKVTKKFPKEEMFATVAQLRRAALSISCNIAEGSARKSKKDQAHFIQMSFSSAVEVVNLLIITHELSLIGKEDYLALRDAAEKLTNQLNSFHKRLLADATR